jgi:hypothetical protein
MRNLIILFSLVSIGAQAQVRDLSLCIEKRAEIRAPAPCSIKGVSEPTWGWLVQIGAYRQLITPNPGVFAYYFEDAEGGIYFYYIDKNYSEAQARMTAHMLRSAIFCDAIAVPNPVPTILFQQPKKI